MHGPSKDSLREKIEPLSILFPTLEDSEERDVRRTVVGEAIQLRASPLRWEEPSSPSPPPIPNAYDEWKAGHLDEAGSARPKCIERLILWLA